MTVHTGFKSLFCRREIASEVWTNLPIWFLFVEAIGILHFMVANMPAADYEKAGHALSSYAWTTVFPLAWVVVFYAIRARDSKRLSGLGTKKYLVPAAIAIVPFAIYWWYRIFPFFRFELAPKPLVGAFRSASTPLDRAVHRAFGLVGHA
ncbi:MAG: hypothetical protein M5R36_22345 [Deltaproteobacteria bacterium]|nr:hypothetical protein [Deltaproteobacteria bacterium]